MHCMSTSSHDSTELQVVFPEDSGFQGQTMRFKDGPIEDSNKPSYYVSKLVKLALCIPNDTATMLSSLPSGMQTTLSAYQQHTTVY